MITGNNFKIMVAYGYIWLLELYNTIGITVESAFNDNISEKTAYEHLHNSFISECIAWKRPEIAEATL